MVRSWLDTGESLSGRSNTTARAVGQEGAFLPLLNKKMVSVLRGVCVGGCSTAGQKEPGEEASSG